MHPDRGPSLPRVLLTVELSFRSGRTRKSLHGIRFSPRLTSRTSSGVDPFHTDNSRKNSGKTEFSRLRDRLAARRCAGLDGALLCWQRARVSTKDRPSPLPAARVLQCVRGFENSRGKAHSPVFPTKSSELPRTTHFDPSARAVKTLDLDEAAEFLHMHPEEVRTRTKRGLIPGAKAGRRWVFLEIDLADFLRSLYPVRRQALQVTNSQEGVCHLESAGRSGGSTSSRRMASEYDDLLRPATRSKRKSCTTS